MHRTQIYFEENLFKEIKEQAQLLNISISAYIRQILQKDLQERKNRPTGSKFSEFSGMWEGREITQESLRKDAWK